jgi:hypothetical protein
MKRATEDQLIRASARTLRRSSTPEDGARKMKLKTWYSAEDKRRWKIVRADDLSEVAGEIITADTDTGECRLLVGDEIKTLRFKPQEIMMLPLGEHIWKPYPGGGSICSCGAARATDGTVWFKSLVYNGPCSSSAPSAPEPDSREIDGVKVTGPPS